MRIILKTFLSIIVTSNLCFAGGFELLEQSTESVGTAFSGGVAGYGDGSESILNPAALSKIKNTFFYAAGNIQSSQFDFDDSFTGNGTDGGKALFVPNIYLVRPVNQQTTLALSITSPFGISTEYDNSWAGRYEADSTTLTTANVSLAAGYEFNQNFSLGLNLGLLYGDAEFSNAITNFNSDGNTNFDGDDIAPSWGLGALYSYGYNNENRIGISYRGYTDLNLSGTASTTLPSQSLFPIANFNNSSSSASSDLSLPESIAIGLKHWLHPELAFMWESKWTRWTRMEELRINYDSLQSDSVNYFGWNNAWRHSAGFEYLATTNTDLRFGLSYDLSPASDSNSRNPRMPDADKIWLGLGLGYKVNDVLKFDFAYAHAFVDSESTNINSSTNQRVLGDWDASLDIYSMSLTWSFN
jgi:long-chain fatty acid transport protein